MKTFFVSSTFKDMQAERDVLHQVVFPALRNHLKAYGEEVDELDLRWGVDTSLMSEEESGRFVVETCLDAIDRCRPYMIVFIGERYGWIPEETVWASVKDARLDKWRGTPVSVTQLEILYGALEHDDLKRCIFCFRDENFSKLVPEKLRAQYSAESEEHRKRLAHFKEKIKSMPDANVIEYAPVWDAEKETLGALESLTDELINRLSGMLATDLAAERALSLEERIIRDAQLTAKNHMRTYVERSALGDGTSVASGRSSLWFYGEGGCGKSAYLSSVYTSFQKTGVSAFIYYCGNASCANTDTFLNTLMYWLCCVTGEQESLQITSLTRLQKLKRIIDLMKAERRCSCVILVDAADQMQEDITKILCLLGKAASENSICMVVTSTDAYYEAHEGEIEVSGFSKRTIGAMEPSEAAALAQRHAAKRGKHISGEIIEMIRAKQRYTNPYYLSLALQEIFMMNEADFKAAEALAPGMEGISLYMQQLFSAHPEDIREMTLHMLSFATKRLDCGLVQVTANEIADANFLLRLLAVSENGLSLREMETLCIWSGKMFLPMATERLFTFLYDALGENADGKWNFTHRLIREGLLAQLTEAEKQSICGLLCAHYAQSGDDAQSFYYALKSGDANRIRTALSSNKANNAACLSVFGTHLSSIGIVQAFKLITENADSFAYLAARVVLEDADTAMCSYHFWHTLLTKAIEELFVSEQTKFYLVAAKTALLRYGDDKQALVESYNQMCDLYPSCAVQAAPVLLEAVLGLLCFNAHASYAEHIRRGIELLSNMLQDKAECDKDILSVCTEIEMLIGFWQAAQDSKGDALVQAMTNIRITIVAAMTKMRLKSRVDLNRTENMVCSMLHRQLVYVAEELQQGGKYSLASEVLGEALPYYTERMEFFPDAEDRIGYAEWLLNKSACVKTEFQGKYIALFQEQWHQLLAHAPLPYFERLLGYGYYLETENLKAQKREETADTTFEEKIQIAYNKGVRIYEKLCAQRHGEEQYLKALDMLSYFLYNRINTRLELDIWNWKEDRAYYYKKGEKRKSALMEADLEQVVEVSKRLCGKEDHLQRLYELAWGYVLGIRYYNYRQDKEKAVLYCKGLLECMDEILHLEPTGGNYTKAVFYMELAECAERLWREDKASEFAIKAVEYFSLIKAEWIEKRKYTQRIAEEKVRAILVLLRTCTEEEELQVYARQAKESLHKFGDGRADVRRCALWNRSLHTSVGMWYYKNNDAACAKEAFEAAAQTYTRPIASLYMKTKEPELIEITRFLEGQMVYALLKQDKGLADACLRRFAVTIATNTPDEASAARPLLLEFVKRVAPGYKATFGTENEDIHYVLMETKAARWEENYRKASVLVQQRLRELSVWEKTGDRAEDAYLDLLKACAEAISKAGENCDKNSAQYNELVLLAMELKRKYAHHYWAVGNVRYAVSYERDFTDQFSYRKELMEQAYSAQDCLAYWQTLKKKILASEYHSRNAEADIANLQEFGLSVYYRNYEQTKDLQYLHRALEDIFAYRAYLKNRFGINEKDDSWFKEVYHGFYTREQNIYLAMQEDGRVAEEAWLPQLLDSLGIQLQIKLYLPSTFYPKKLDMLYALLNSGVQNRLAVQKAIDMTQAAQSGKDNDLMYYMHSALRELGNEASIEEVEEHIRKLQEENLP